MNIRSKTIAPGLYSGADAKQYAEVLKCLPKVTTKQHLLWVAYGRNAAFYLGGKLKVLRIN
jgi:hypothetical protein